MNKTCLWHVRRPQRGFDPGLPSLLRAHLLQRHPHKAFLILGRARQGGIETGSAHQTRQGNRDFGHRQDRLGEHGAATVEATGEVGQRILRLAALAPDVTGGGPVTHCSHAQQRQGPLVSL
jgi:hypothetical protein